MNQEEFTSALSIYLDDSGSAGHSDVTDTGGQLSAPLNNFFHDDMLMVLSRNGDVLPRRLAELRKQLAVVSDKKLARHERAEAAVEVGRYIRDQRGKATAAIGDGTSKPCQWFQLAADLNSVVGAWELANEHLAKRDLEVKLDRTVDLLPTLTFRKDRDASNEFFACPAAVNAWWLGAKIALRHLQSHFRGWEAGSFDAALACVVNWLVLWPRPTFGVLRAEVLRRRVDSLAWVNPLWKRLIEIGPKAGPDQEAYRLYLLDQRKAASLLLSDQEDAYESACNHRMAVDTSATGKSIVVISGVIAPASDKSDASYLKPYEALRRPVPLTTLPDMQRLTTIRENLQTEFPWAVDAIAVVMRDLFARRRYGAVRLGIQPVLFAGPPGSGKTRFAQRLSELLGTPNTVINLAGMSDVKLLKGVTRGWSSNRPSRMIEFIQQTGVANPLFILDEVDKAQKDDYGNGGRPHDALLDLLEPRNARRYTDVYLMTECNLSHCLYVLTANSLSALPEPLQSRVRIVFFPPPGPEYTPVIARGILRDMELAWDIPQGALTLSAKDMSRLMGLPPREMKKALLDFFGEEDDGGRYTVH